ncbi:Rap1a/Tai family immunity protein [Sphingomonas sp.]|jgi:hypothetical protein|uniref:Rap1a/Tai family immunity protein n=1 Tax=Sphingomonas sp. TaxID=28214 RepID=UPI002E32B1F1|nr:Rap1a/Tai family immunity protein [Sphingomonas sp.]HEX4695953.1 Rap1a/Tai family immunity protein [Sphingomonas sp.]
MIAVMLMLQEVTVTNFETGKSLFARCVSVSAEDQAACAAYVTGVADLAETGKATKSLPPLICAPAGTTPDKLKDVVVRYLRANADERSLAASGIVIAALSNAFPCAKRK